MNHLVHMYVFQRQYDLLDITLGFYLRKSLPTLDKFVECLVRA